MQLSIDAKPALTGDVNNDGLLNIQDVILLVSTILNTNDYIQNGDMNQDGVLEVVDIVQLVSLILDS